MLVCIELSDRAVAPPSPASCPPLPVRWKPQSIVGFGLDRRAARYACVGQRIRKRARKRWEAGRQRCSITYSNSEKNTSRSDGRAFLLKKNPYNSVGEKPFPTEDSLQPNRVRRYQYLSVAETFSPVADTYRPYYSQVVCTSAVTYQVEEEEEAPATNTYSVSDFMRLSNNPIRRFVPRLVLYSSSRVSERNLRGVNRCVRGTRVQRARTGAV